jgi:hypothetical protein
VLRKIFGPKRDEVIAEWRRLHIEELCALYSSLNIIRVGRSGRMRWTVQAARMMKGRVYTRLWGNLKERDDLNDLGVDGWIILKWGFRVVGAELC